MTGYLILILLTLITFLFLIGIFSNSNRDERIRLENLVANQIVTQINNIKTYGQEAHGWKNNFPSFLGWEKTTLQISKNFILVTGKSNFPFLFRSELQPFLISLEPEQLIRTLGYNRIYKPFNLRITNYGNDLELTIKPAGLFGPLKIDLTFEHIGKDKIDRITEITNWC